MSAKPNSARWQWLLVSAASTMLFAAGCSSARMPLETSTVGNRTVSNPTIITMNDSSGQLATFSQMGPIPTRNPFFKKLGTNGRTCNSCHLIDQGWSITPSEVQARFDKDGGLDPIFAPVDGTNCPTDKVSTVAERAAATTLLRTKGLIRIARPIPAGAEFNLTAVDDPYNCSVDGLSLYRRPLPTTNVAFLSDVMWDGRESSQLSLFDGLKNQARDATTGHAEASQDPSERQLEQIVNFELAIFTAQSFDNAAGPLDALQAQGGPKFLSQQNFHIGINDFGGGSNGFSPDAMTMFEPWSSLSTTDQFTAGREAIARGEEIFNTTQMFIANVPGLNDELNTPLITGPCSTCHDSPNLGNVSVQRLMNVGTADLFRRTSDMPLYTFSCNDGSTHQVTDAGLAMSTGKCKDIAKFKVPILRGLAARAPYFHDGSAVDLTQVLDFYRIRFGLNLTAQQQSDLIAFLNSL